MALAIATSRLLLRLADIYKLMQSAEAFLRFIFLEGRSISGRDHYFFGIANVFTFFPILRPFHAALEAHLGVELRRGLSIKDCEKHEYDAQCQDSHSQCRDG